MAGVFKDALRNSTQDFNRHVKPILSALWKGCQIFSCEDQQDPLLRALDNYAGIDYLILRENQQRIIGLASRIQRGFNFQTFTIRAARESGTKTELEKRLNAITGGAYVFDESMKKRLVDDITDEVVTAITEAVQQATEQFRNYSMEHDDMFTSAFHFVKR